MLRSWQGYRLVAVGEGVIGHKLRMWSLIVIRVMGITMEGIMLGILRMGERGVWMRRGMVCR